MIASIGPTSSKARTGMTRKVATAQASPPATPMRRPTRPSRCSSMRMAVPTTAERIAQLKITFLRPQAWASDPPMVGVLPSIRSEAAKTSATWKITVAAVATTEPQARATMTPNAVAPQGQADRCGNDGEGDDGGDGGHDREPDHLPVLPEEVERSPQDRLAGWIGSRHLAASLSRRLRLHHIDRPCLPAELCSFVRQVRFRRLCRQAVGRMPVRLQSSQSRSLRARSRLLLLSR